MISLPSKFGIKFPHKWVTNWNWAFIMHNTWSHHKEATQNKLTQTEFWNIPTRKNQPLFHFPCCEKTLKETIGTFKVDAFEKCGLRISILHFGYNTEGFESPLCAAQLFLVIIVISWWPKTIVMLCGTNKILLKGKIIYRIFSVLRIRAVLYDMGSWMSRICYG